MHRPIARHSAGFTLLELIIALSVLGLLCSLTYSAVSVGLRSWESAQIRVNRLDDFHISWHFLQDALTHAKPVFDPQSQPNDILFRGSSQQLSFVSTISNYVGFNGLSLIDLYTDPQTQQFYLRSRSFTAYQQSDNSATYTTLLLEDLEQLNIAYFGRPHQQRVATWHAQWLSNQRLPDLIRIQIKTHVLGEWPTLWIAPL